MSAKEAKRNKRGGPGAPDREEQLRRIAEHEALLTRLERFLSDPAPSEDGLTAAREAAGALEAYYGSPLWKRDFADDEAGLLPKDLPRGVLSEDGIYNALEAWRERLEELR